MFYLYMKNTNELLKVNQVMEILKCKSKSTIYNLMNESEFPKPIKLTERSTRWQVSEINKWLTNREKQKNYSNCRTKKEVPNMNRI